MKTLSRKELERHKKLDREFQIFVRSFAKVNYRALAERKTLSVDEMLQTKEGNR